VAPGIDVSKERRAPVVDFDHHRPADQSPPHEVFRELRGRCPVAWSESHGGFWVVSKHDEVGRVLKDGKTFSTARDLVREYGTATTIPPMPVPPFLPQELDGADHLKYRRLLNAVLSPTASAALLPRIEYWTEHYLAALAQAQDPDLLYDFAIPVPAAVSLEWLGFPETDWRRMSESFHDLVSFPPGHERAVAGVEGLTWMGERAREELLDRREHPRDDVLSYLIAQQVDGQPIALGDAQSIVVQVIGGGVETTTSLVASALLHLHRHHEDRDRLRSEPGIWDTATEEFLRAYPPFMNLARTVKQDVELGGCLMRRGDRVLASEGSACHDEDQYASPEEVVLDRFPNRHLAFGLGPHRCPGMHLARLEFKEMTRRMLLRYPDYVVDEERVRGYPSQASMAGWATMPGSVGTRIAGGGR
jgi:cytochrome P450